MRGTPPEHPPPHHGNHDEQRRAKTAQTADQHPRQREGLGPRNLGRCREGSGRGPLRVRSCRWGRGRCGAFGCRGLTVARGSRLRVGCAHRCNLARARFCRRSDSTRNAIRSGQEPGGGKRVCRLNTVARGLHASRRYTAWQRGFHRRSGTLQPRRGLPGSVAALINHRTSSRSFRFFGFLRLFCLFPKNFDRFDSGNERDVLSRRALRHVIELTLSRPRAAPGRRSTVTLFLVTILGREEISVPRKASDSCRKKPRANPHLRAAKQRPSRKLWPGRSPPERARRTRPPKARQP